MTLPVLHVLGSLEVGGKERAVLRLVQHGIRDGQRHALLAGAHCIIRLLAKWPEKSYFVPKGSRYQWRRSPG